MYDYTSMRKTFSNDGFGSEPWTAATKPNLLINAFDDKSNSVQRKNLTK
jgi:hypothetical protein